MLAFDPGVTLVPRTTRFEMDEPLRSPPVLEAEAWEIELDVIASAVISPPKRETELTFMEARPTARSPEAVALVPPVIPPVVTAPFPYDQLTTEDADCGGDEMAPADTGPSPGTTTRTPNALADDAAGEDAAPEEPTDISARRRETPRTTRKHTGRGYRRARPDWVRSYSVRMET